MHRSCSLLFRFDAGPQVGLGHWYRCIALADSLRMRGTDSVHLLVNALSLPLERELHQLGIPYTQSARWGEPSAVLDYSQAFPHARLVLDTMETTAAFVNEIQQRGMPVLSIGGSGLGRDLVQVRIDGMVWRLDYASAFAGERLYFGPKYVILRSHFNSASPMPTRPRIRSVLVALGGDASAVGLGVARAVRSVLADSQVDVLLGPLAPEALSGGPGIRTHRGVGNPRPLMEGCDVAIVSGGMSAYELMRLGRPLLLLPQTGLQDIASRALVEAGTGVVVTREDQTTEARRQEALKVCLDQLGNPALRERMAKAGSRLVDGRGLRRVSGIISEWGQRQES